MSNKERFDKVTISIYSKDVLEQEDYNKIKIALKESINPESILVKEFSNFNEIIYNDRINRYCLFFDNIDKFSYQNYIKVLRVEKLEKI